MKTKLEKFKDWLKYFCLSFFLNKYAREGAKRSSFNFFLGVIVAFALVCGGLTVGYNSSFNTHFKDAEQFNEFLDTSLSGVKLSVNGGKLTSDSLIETVSDENSSYRVNGYELIVDTRPADEVFDDFSILCTDKSGNTIDYGEYFVLPASEKSKYSLTLKYSGKVLDTAVKRDMYRAYLDKVSTEGDEKYNADIAYSYSQLKEKEGSGALSGTALDNELYKLYAKSYYPSFDRVEKFASVPTIRSYYLTQITVIGSTKYLLLFDDYVFCSFHTESGIVINFSANKLPDGDVADIGDFIGAAFKSTEAMNFLAFASDMFVSVLILMVIALAVSFVLARLLKKSLEYANSTALFNILGGFLPVSGIVAFVLGIALPYGLAVNSAYLAVRLLFLATVFVRFAVLIVMDIVNNRKKPKAPEEVGDSTEAIDPFVEFNGGAGNSSGALVEFGDEGSEPETPVEGDKTEDK